jgi:hypothetical protein
MRKLICLDLEGTLISNAISQIPRPNLHDFLCELSPLGDVILYTSVSPTRTAEIKHLLVSEEYAPPWFASIPSIHPERTIKHKHLVPGVTQYDLVLLLDDQSGVIAAEEHDWWVQIKEFSSPYPQDDRELEVALEQIKTRLDS